MANYRMNEDIKITCCNKIEFWNDREAAKRFYLRAMSNSEGVAFEHYSSIYEQLCCGSVICDDEEDY